MLNPDQQAHLACLEKIARELGGASRATLEPELHSLAAALGLDRGSYKHLGWPLPSWPQRGERAAAKADELRYAVDFTDDQNRYAATFEEVRQLLNYTRDSCKVAFGTNRGTIDRTNRPTKLGACVITRLPTAIQLSDYPGVLRLEAKTNQPRPIDRFRRLRKKKG